MLVLKQSRVTDAGLRELAGLKAVEFLNLAETKVTDRGVESLRKELPRLKKVFR